MECNRISWKVLEMARINIAVRRFPGIRIFTQTLDGNIKWPYSESLLKNKTKQTGNNKWHCPNPCLKKFKNIVVVLTAISIYFVTI